MKKKFSRTYFNEHYFLASTQRLKNHLLKHTGGINKLINLLINSYGKSYLSNKKSEVGSNLDQLKELIYSKKRLHIPILATRHVASYARRISEALSLVDIDSEVIFAKPETGFDEQCIYFVLCPQMFNELPKYYFAFQLEQSVSQRWMTSDYYDKLKKAIAIIDYSIDNVSFFIKKGFDYKDIYYIPVRPLNIKNSDTDYLYDVIFYGDDNCERRKRIINELQKHFSVKICKEMYGEELENELKKAKIAINIHYYENSLLESVRLSELIEMGKVIVSEKGSNYDENEFFKKYVHMVEVDDVQALIQKIESLLSCNIENSEVTVNNEHNEFLFYFFRMLLAYDLITFDQFYYKIGNKVNIPDVLCLSVIESIDRHNTFREKHPKIDIFNGLRHYVPWKGCGLSYKFLMKRAYDLKKVNITIFEDDVSLPNNWEISLNAIKRALSNKKWDMFTGLIAEVHPDCQLFYKEETSLGTLIQLDKVVSLVFCLYNNSVYEKIFTWDHQKDGIENTIDRYIQRTSTINSYCLFPFFVKLSDSDSTLWNNVDNGSYNIMIQRSESLLAEKIQNYDKCNTNS